MTYNLSNRGLNALRVLMAADRGYLTKEEFAAFNQTTVGGFGRRRDPLVVKAKLSATGEEVFKVTNTAREIMRAYDQTDIFRKLSSQPLASVFQHRTRLRIVARRRAA